MANDPDTYSAPEPAASPARTLTIDPAVVRANRPLRPGDQLTIDNQSGVEVIAGAWVPGRGPMAEAEGERDALWAEVERLNETVASIRAQWDADLKLRDGLAAEVVRLTAERDAILRWAAEHADEFSIDEEIDGELGNGYSAQDARGEWHGSRTLAGAIRKAAGLDTTTTREASTDAGE